MTKLTKPNNSKQLATFCCKIAADKIAIDLIVLDLTEIEQAPANYFVLCSTESENQSQAILDMLLRQSKNVGLDKPKVEGGTTSEWILIDYFDVVVHIMLKQAREFYNIDDIWKEANKLVLNQETGRLVKH